MKQLLATVLLTSCLLAAVTLAMLPDMTVLPTSAVLLVYSIVLLTIVGASLVTRQ